MKKKEELLIATLLLHQLGYKPNEEMSGESPDLLIPTRKDGTIGIEITKYVSEEVSEDFNTFQKLLNKYVRLFGEKKKRSNLYNKEQSYQIKIWLHRGFPPSIKKCTQKEKQIFAEIDNLLFPTQGAFINNEYVSLAETYPINYTASEASISYISMYEEIDNALLYKCIKDKEKKLKTYKALQQNKNVKEYYLLIHIPELHQIDIKDYKLPINFQTDYNRIYLSRGADCILIYEKKI